MEYFSPERAAEYLDTFKNKDIIKTHSAKFDVYSVGIIAYLLCTSHRHWIDRASLTYKNILKELKHTHTHIDTHTLHRLALARIVSRGFDVNRIHTSEFNCVFRKNGGSDFSPRELILSLLEFNPHKRLGAKEALDKYFYVETPLTPLYHEAAVDPDADETPHHSNILLVLLVLVGGAVIIILFCACKRRIIKTCGKINRTGGSLSLLEE
eukprot:GHVR01055504.1.p1 GENE.GHVR01055504.1~~GHVR01055504.1.p1  ORF type:complete len:231 (-),score=74.16 GHVR01055504.1:561-1190(-)